jgi:peroxin-4
MHPHQIIYTMDWNKRLMREAKSFIPDDTVLSLAPCEDRLDQWSGTISGPLASPYAGGRFTLSISIPKTYPISPPSISFSTLCCHPNVEVSSGKICLDLLDTAWSPFFTLHSALTAMAVLLSVSADIALILSRTLNQTRP